MPRKRDIFYTLLQAADSCSCASRMAVEYVKVSHGLPRDHVRDQMKVHENKCDEKSGNIMGELYCPS